jgi:hypothetical protein
LIKVVPPPVTVTGEFTGTADHDEKGVGPVAPPPPPPPPHAVSPKAVDTDNIVKTFFLNINAP